MIDPERDAFMMDFENSCLLQNWDNAKKQHPTGLLRHPDSEWVAMIKSQVYPHHSDIDWEEYCEWVFHGGGDECFQADEESEMFLERMLETTREEQFFLPGYYEAQTRLRTPYLCKDMVRPLSTPLVERIVALAHINGQQQTPTHL